MTSAHGDEGETIDAMRLHDPNVNEPPTIERP